LNATTGSIRFRSEEIAGMSREEFGRTEYCCNIQFAFQDTMVSFSSRFLAFYTIADHRIGWSNFDQERIVDRIYKIVRVPAGAFLMGNYEYDDEQAVRVVFVPDYWMSMFAETFREYDAYCLACSKKKPDDRKWGRGGRPVIHVSWDDAQAYVSGMGKAYSLPTEPNGKRPHGVLWAESIPGVTTNRIGIFVILEKPIKRRLRSRNSNHRCTASIKWQVILGNGWRIFGIIHMMMLRLMVLPGSVISMTPSGCCAAAGATPLTSAGRRFATPVGPAPATSVSVFVSLSCIGIICTIAKKS